MTQGEIVDGEPRRILFEYISALSQENYKKAVYYYGGSYDLLIKLNPDISPNDKPKLFERYCIKNGGKCLISEYPYFIDIKSSMQLKSGNWNCLLNQTISRILNSESGVLIMNLRCWICLLASLRNDYRLMRNKSYIRRLQDNS